MQSLLRYRVFRFLVKCLEYYMRLQFFYNVRYMHIQLLKKMTNDQNGKKKGNVTFKCRKIM